MAVGDFGLAYLHLIAFLATIAQDVGGEHTSLAPPSPGLSSSAGTFSSTTAFPPSLPPPLPPPLLRCHGPWFRADRSGWVLVGGICFKRRADANLGRRWWTSGAWLLCEGVVSARQMMTTCQNLILSPGMGGDPRGPRAHWRSPTGMKFDMAQFFLTPENA
jgi:hypothetical protein